MNNAQHKSEAQNLTTENWKLLIISFDVKRQSKFAYVSRRTVYFVCQKVTVTERGYKPMRPRPKIHIALLPIERKVSDIDRTGTSAEKNFNYFNLYKLYSKYEEMLFR